MLNELMARETEGWNALATSGEAGRAFYGEALLEDAVFAFPGDMRIEGRSAILDSIDERPWLAFEINDPAIVALGRDAWVLTYRVRAERGGSEPYRALVSSIYVREGDDVRVAFHQQTPA